MLKREVRALQNISQNTEQLLVQTAREEWNNIPQQNVDNLVRSMKTRLETRITTFTIILLNIEIFNVVDNLNLNNLKQLVLIYYLKFSLFVLI